ncbi:MAG: hypothetical protein IKO78_00630 [Bacilli bacterium]|nr:hypothetical protein [Bacilli bacterium]
MKNEKKYFLGLRRKVINYNKILMCIFGLFILYALVYSVSMLDCTGVDYYNLESINYTKDMLVCENMSTGLLAFFINNHILICVILGIAAVVVLVLQKLALLKINQLDVNELEEEKVNKNQHILYTLLLGYTGAHKFRTYNKPIGYIYLVNFIAFAVSWLVKTFAVDTYNEYLAFHCAYKFSLVFIIGILVLNVIEAVFSFISLKDDDDKIFG